MALYKHIYFTRVCCRVGKGVYPLLVIPHRHLSNEEHSASCTLLYARLILPQVSELDGKLQSANRQLAVKSSSDGDAVTDLKKEIAEFNAKEKASSDRVRVAEERTQAGAAGYHMINMSSLITRA